MEKLPENDEIKGLQPDGSVIIPAEDMHKYLSPSQVAWMKARWCCDLPPNLAIWVNEFIWNYVQSGGDLTSVTKDTLLQAAKEQHAAFSKLLERKDFSLTDMRVLGLSVIVNLAVLLDLFGLIGLGDVFTDRGRVGMCP